MFKTVDQWLMLSWSGASRAPDARVGRAGSARAAQIYQPHHGAAHGRFRFLPRCAEGKHRPGRYYPMMPTLPNQLEHITRSIDETLTKIVALLLDTLVNDARNVLKSADQLVGSPPAGSVAITTTLQCQQ
jgi:hypothetical protein